MVRKSCFILGVGLAIRWWVGLSTNHAATILWFAAVAAGLSCVMEGRRGEAGRQLAEFRVRAGLHRRGDRGGQGDPLGAHPQLWTHPLATTAAAGGKLNPWPTARRLGSGG